MLKNLKSLREDASVSQKQLAEAIGVSQQSINKYENHSIEPDISTLIRIADYFDTSVDYLIGNTSVRRKIENVTTYDLNTEESKLINHFRKLSKKKRLCIAAVIDCFIE